jgi:uncharacterized protein YceH (UPF0502 family)
MQKVLISLLVLILVSCKKSSKNPVETLSHKTVQQQITTKETQRILFTLSADSMRVVTQRKEDILKQQLLLPTILS